MPPALMGLDRELLRLTGIAALGANLVDNLPSYLAIEPVAAGSAVRMAALLVGVNVGPLITLGPAWPPCCGPPATVPRASLWLGACSPSTV